PSGCAFDTRLSCPSNPNKAHAGRRPGSLDCRVPKYRYQRWYLHKERPPSDKPLVCADPSWLRYAKLPRCGRLYRASTRYWPTSTRITASPSRWTLAGAKEQLRRDDEGRGESSPDATAVALRIQAPPAPAPATSRGSGKGACSARRPTAARRWVLEWYEYLAHTWPTVRRARRPVAAAVLGGSATWPATRGSKASKRFLRRQAKNPGVYCGNVVQRPAPHNANQHRN
ncbi:LOW QUALITY PROTEIN: hypothetical protein N5P37_000850, partial [Trichoderma harzianum]